MEMRLGRDRESLDATTAPPFTVGEVIKRLNAIAALDDDGRKALEKDCSKKTGGHVPTGEGHCWKCGKAE